MIYTKKKNNNKKQVGKEKKVKETFYPLNKNELRVCEDFLCQHV